MMTLGFKWLKSLDLGQDNVFTLIVLQTALTVQRFTNCVYTATFDYELCISNRVLSSDTGIRLTILVLFLTLLIAYHTCI